MKFSLKRVLLPLALGASLLLTACGESEKERLQRELAELSAQVAANQQILDEQNSELASFETRKAATIAAIAEAETLQAQLENSIAELESQQGNLTSGLDDAIESKSAAVAALTTQVDQLSTQLAELQAMQEAEAAFFMRAQIIAPSTENGAFTVHKFDVPGTWLVRTIDWNREQITYAESTSTPVTVEFSELDGHVQARLNALRASGQWLEVITNKVHTEGSAYYRFYTDYDTGLILDQTYSNKRYLSVETFAQQPEAYQAQLAELEAGLRMNLIQQADAEDVGQTSQTQETEIENGNSSLLASLGFLLFFIGMVFIIFVGSPVGVIMFLIGGLMMAIS